MAGSEEEEDPTMEPALMDRLLPALITCTNLFKFLIINRQMVP